MTRYPETLHQIYKTIIKIIFANQQLLSTLSNLTPPKDHNGEHSGVKSQSVETMNGYQRRKGSEVAGRGQDGPARR